MDDQAFMKAFEDGTLAPSQFTHEAHIRMAWLYLRAYGWDEGIAHIRDGIQQFAQRVGASTKYHETITTFWARIVLNMIHEQPMIERFEEFMAHFPQVLDSRLISRHYSVGLLVTPVARQAWVEPDLRSLPPL